MLKEIRASREQTTSPPSRCRWNSFEIRRETTESSWPQLLRLSFFPLPVSRVFCTHFLFFPALPRRRQYFQPIRVAGGGGGGGGIGQAFSAPPLSPSFSLKTSLRPRRRRSKRRKKGRGKRNRADSPPSSSVQQRESKRRFHFTVRSWHLPSLRRPQPR